MWRVNHRIYFLFIFFALIHNVTVSALGKKRSILILKKTYKLQTFGLKLFYQLQTNSDWKTWGMKELECPGSDDCFSFNLPEPELQPKDSSQTWKFSPKVSDKFHPSPASAANLFITMYRAHALWRPGRGWKQPSQKQAIKAPKPAKDQLRWLDLKHMWAPRWSPEPGPCSVNTPVILNTEGVEGL